MESQQDFSCVCERGRFCINSVVFPRLIKERQREWQEGKNLQSAKLLAQKTGVQFLCGRLDCAKILWVQKMENLPRPRELESGGGEGGGERKQHFNGERTSSLFHRTAVKILEHMYCFLMRVLLQGDKAVCPEQGDSSWVRLRLLRDRDRSKLLPSKGFTCLRTGQFTA